MPNCNVVVIAGHLTRDPELRFLASGTAVAELGIAVNERVKRGEEWVDEPVFIDVTVWGKSAENSSQYLKKGSAALVEGRLKLDSWEKDGQKRSKLKVVANKVQFLGGKPERVQAAIDDGPPFDADEEALTF